MNKYFLPRPGRWWDFPAVILLLAALTTVAIRLSDTEWTSFLYITETLVILGTLLGLAIGYSRFPTWINLLLILSYSVIIVPWQLGRTVVIFVGSDIWLNKLNILVSRLETVIFQLVNREPVVDSILFLVLMAFLFWFIGIIGGYYLTRHGTTWPAILTAGLVLVILQYFDPADKIKTWFLAAFFFICLMVISRINFIHNRARWEKSRTALPPYLGLDFVRFSLFTAGAIIIFAWFTPAFSSTLPEIQKALEPVRNRWSDVQDRLDNLFANLKTTLNVPTEYFGTTLSLGQGSKLTNEIVFWVKPSSSHPKGIRLYWRARVYDVYNGNEWKSPGLTVEPWNHETSQLALTPDSKRWESDFDVNASSFITTLLSPSQPLWVSRDGSVDLVTNSDQTVELYAFKSEPLVRPGQYYRTRGSISNATIYDLRHAGTEYPDWVSDRYLQLPPSITARTKELAQTITTGLENPYDKTAALIKFLHDNYQYSELISLPPPDQEAVDWFLFDYQKGFCNYYASSAVVMLRSLGIPSRLAVGYASGDEDENGIFTVHQKESHAWPEVYFPGLGWVEFEPTASQPEIVRPIGRASEGDLSNQPSDAEPFRFPTPASEIDPLFDPNSLRNQSAGDGGLSTFQVFLVILISFSMISYIYLRLKRSRKWGNYPALPVVLVNILTRLNIRSPKRLQEWYFMSTLSPITVAYLEINRALHRIDRIPPSNATPLERVSRLGVMIPEALPPATELVLEYQKSIFSQAKTDPELAIKAGKEVRNLSIRKRLQQLGDRLRHLSLRRITRKTVH